MMWRTVLMVCLLGVAGLPAMAQSLTGRFILVNQDGKRVSDRTYEGKIRLVAFGYTFCPDICPTSLANMAGALEQLGDRARQIVPIFITVDPKRDTPEHLKDYVGSFGPDFVGLTGTPEMIAAAVRNFNVQYQIQPPDDAGQPDLYTVDHSSGIYVLDRAGNFVVRLGHQTSPSELAARLQGMLIP